MDPNLNLNGLAGSGGVQPQAGSRAGKSSPSGGPAFQALLDKLEAHARDLRNASSEIEDAGGLAGAVDRSRASIEDAMSLHDQLLEAYRAANLNPEQDAA